jgi:glycosyltransferase involved in cell wall biosynthesis
LKIVAVIPCLNEAEHIGAVVAGARKYCDAVIVADNGSTDGTTKAANEAGAIVTVCKSKGLGNNIRTSLLFTAEHNMADIIILLDGDGQHNPRLSSQLS